MVLIGAFGRPWGVRGWLKFHPYTDSALDYSPWFEQNEHGEYVQLSIASCNPHGQVLVVKFNGFDDRNDVQSRFGGVKVYVQDAVLPSLPEDEYYWRDLIGLSVVDQHDKVLGCVDSMIETPVHDVLKVVCGKNGKSTLIPFTKRFVPLVSIQQKLIHVVWEQDY